MQLASACLCNFILLDSILSCNGHDWFSDCSPISSAIRFQTVSQPNRVEWVVAYVHNEIRFAINITYLHQKITLYTLIIVISGKEHREILSKIMSQPLSELRNEKIPMLRESLEKSLHSWLNYPVDICWHGSMTWTDNSLIFKLM